MHLPGKEPEDGDVDTDVGRTSPVLTLLHPGHKRRRYGPQHSDTRAGEEVRAREELANAEVGVARALGHVLTLLNHILTTCNLENILPLLNHSPGTYTTVTQPRTKDTY